jgi:hypothetical protein
MAVVVEQHARPIAEKAFNLLNGPLEMYLLADQRKQKERPILLVRTFCLNP